jgi:hypothetical protein
MALRAMFDEVSQTLDDMEKMLDGEGVDDEARLPIAEIRRRNAALIDAQVLRRWRLIIPGQRSASLSNQRLLHLFQQADRDFEQDTVQLRQARRAMLRRRFATLPRLASFNEVAEFDAGTIKHWVTERRLQRGGGDLLLPRLSESTLASKARRGFGGEPIGVASGQWRDAIRKNGRVEFY